MFSIKKTTMAMLLLSSSSAFSGTMGPVCVAGDVSVPCYSGWDFGIYALYLHPSYSGTPSNFNFNGSFTDDDGAVVNHTLKKAWEWGFKLEALYRFNTGIDINLNWSNWADTNNELLHGISPVRYKTLKIKAEWDAVNLEIGQGVAFGDHKNIRFHGGVQYAHLQHDGYQRITGSTPALDYTNTGRVPVIDPVTGLQVQIPFYSLTIQHYKFNGVGPRTGVDMAYDWVYGLKLYANAAVALLVGDNSYQIQATGDEQRLSSGRGSHTAIIPELDGRVGVKYDYSLSQGNLTLDVGFMVVNYFNAFQDDNNVTHFGLNGPYVGLKWMGNL